MKVTKDSRNVAENPPATRTPATEADEEARMKTTARRLVLEREREDFVNRHGSD